MEGMVMDLFVFNSFPLYFHHTYNLPCICSTRQTRSLLLPVPLPPETDEKSVLSSIHNSLA